MYNQTITNNRTVEEYDQFLKSWLGTPYKHDMCVKGIHGGVDCVRFVTSVLEWMNNREGNAACFPFNFGSMASWCNKLPGLQVISWFQKRYECEIIYRKSKNDLIPNILIGDCIVCDDDGDSAVHIMIGGLNGSIWHSVSSIHKLNSGVRHTGMTEKLAKSTWRIWRIKAARNII